MTCNHDTITDIKLNDEYVLVYCGDDFKEAIFASGEVKSAHTVEVFNSAQELLDRGLALGLACSIGHLLTAAEHGAVLNAFCEEYLISEVWDMDIDFINRANALGYTE